MPNPAPTISPSEAGHPPDPPHLDRRIQIALRRAVLLLIPLTIVVLALLGVFGNRSTTATAEEPGGLSLTVTHPSRLRHERLMPLDIDVRNGSPRALDTLSVSIEAAYLDKFSQVEATPSPSAPWVVELYDVAPGETRRVALEVHGHRPGRHEGMVTASARDTRPTSVRISTFTFP